MSEEADKPDLRHRILQAAAALFDEKGYEQASMRKLADRIGYSATTIYLHFANKEDLMFAVVDDAFNQFAAALEAAAATDGTHAERLGALAWAYVDFGLDHPTHYRLMFIQKPEFLLQGASDGDEPRLTVLGAFARTVSKVVPTDRGARTLEQFTDALWAALHGVVSLSITMPMFDRERALRAADLSIALVIGAMELVPGER